MSAHLMWLVNQNPFEVTEAAASDEALVIIEGRGKEAASGRGS